MKNTRFLLSAVAVITTLSSVHAMKWPDIVKDREQYNQNEMMLNAIKANDIAKIKELAKSIPLNNKLVEIQYLPPHSLYETYLTDAAVNPKVKPETVQALLTEGADPNIKDKDGRTAMIWAAALFSLEGYQDRFRKIYNLLLAGSNPNVKDTKSGKNTFDYLKDRGFIANTNEELKALLEKHIK